MEPHSRNPAQAGFSNEIETIVAEPGWLRFVPNPARAVGRAARAAGAGGCVVLDSDRAVQRLNALHRGKNKPTNILTYESPAPEMVLALGVVRREARAKGITVARHLAHLIVHGALHLRGMDHLRPGEARRMEMLETRILRRLGIPDPWRRA